MKKNSDESSKRSLFVSVRGLVEFVLRTGDLGGERGFVGPTRALEGTRGHQRVQRSRPQEYQTEVFVSYRIETEDLVLTIKGRIDGLWKTPEGVLLEEIKTTRGLWDGLADPLHWAQGKIYAFVYSEKEKLERITVQLTYLDLDSQKITDFRQVFTQFELSTFFQEVTAVYLEWVTEYHQWCELRDASIRKLPFPFSQYRPGQRPLSVAAYRAITQAGTLFAEAPTGIGKTISVLFPAVRALAEGALERIFYLTAKTIGRAVAEKAFADMRNAGLRFRTVTLTAKEKVCFNDGLACDVSDCPFARGYYDRVKGAIREALKTEALTRSVIEEIARRHQVCPFGLSLDLSLWVDAIICDYNYVFDPAVYLRRYFTEETLDCGFLIDEAHNLVDRAREMFSADLREEHLLTVKAAIQSELPGCAVALKRVVQHVIEERKRAVEVSSGELAEEVSLVQAEVPEELISLLRSFLKEAELWLAQNKPSLFREALLELYFQVTRFLRAADFYDNEYRTLVTVERGRARVRLFCLNPACLLQRALKRAKCAVFFSATLSPLPYFREILGGDDTHSTLQLPSPFPPENLCLLIQDRIATNYAARGSTYDQVSSSIKAAVQAQTGNYLVYFPSYHYLKQVHERFRAAYPEILTHAQIPGMTESERDAFLSAFNSGRAETLVGFAVMGGLFGEGIDLVGNALVGAVIVGVGLPQICLERDLIRDYFERQNGAGFDYAYLYPGLTRVLQAIGRVIRSETDRGVALLIDVRFSQGRYQRRFPTWWLPRLVRNDEQIKAELQKFWR